MLRTVLVQDSESTNLRLNPQFAPAQLYRTEIDIVPALSQTFVNSVRRGLSEEREGFRRSPQGDHAQLQFALRTRLDLHSSLAAVRAGLASNALRIRST
jgi:hypothetical protein